MHADANPCTLPWAVDAHTLATQLGSDPTRGLDADEAERRGSKQRTAESSVHREPPRWLAMTGRQCTNPLVLILVIGAGLAAVLGDWSEAALVMLILAISVGLGVVHEWRASEAMARLRRRLAQWARVRRGGLELEVQVERLVPGDLLILTAGTVVPGDARIVQAHALRMDEAALTGEPLAVDKNAERVAPDTPAPRRTNSVFAGTVVRSGTGIALVTATGSATALGAIAGSLHAAQADTDFARGLRAFGRLLLRVMGVVVVAVSVVNLSLGRPPVESLLFGLALAIGLSPELLPAIVTVMLARGARAMAEQGVLVRRLEAIEDLGAIDVLCTDKTGTLTTGEVVVVDAVDGAGRASDRVRQLALANAKLHSGPLNGLDAALLDDAARSGTDVSGWRRLDDVPYDFERRRLSVLCRPDDRAPALLVTKGAVDEMLAICTRCADAPLDDAARRSLRAMYEGHASHGSRVLAVATKQIAGGSISLADEEDLRFEGFIVFADPPKSDARQAIAALAARGIAVRMVTGDNRHVAAHVAQAVGIAPAPLMTGGDLAALDDAALRLRVADVAVFAEVDPAQKARVVRALQAAGRAVGFLGDGINDAPALCAADVGVSVDDAVDVARQSADIVLLAPDLAALERGVADGRRAFANTLKYVRITTSANFGNIISMAIGACWLEFLPLAAKQVLLNNLLSDVPAMALASDRVEASALSRPQHWKIAALQRYMMVFGLLSSAFDLMAFWLFLRWLDATERSFQTGWFLTSLLTELTVLFVLRTGAPAWSSRPSRGLIGMTCAVAVSAFVLPTWQPAAVALGFVPMPLPWWAAVGTVVLAYVIACEFLKRWLVSRTEWGRQVILL